MSSILEIEKAIEELPAPQVEELVGWLERHRVRRATPPSVESWLQRGPSRRDDRQGDGPHAW